MFNEFWAIYPRKTAKKDARIAWAKLKPSDELATQIIDHVAERAQTDLQWENKLHIPYPATFLNGERWEDEYEAAPKRVETYQRDTSGEIDAGQYERLTGRKL